MVHSRHLYTFIAAEVERTFSLRGERSHGTFSQVIVNRIRSVFPVEEEPVPEVIQIVQRLHHVRASELVILSQFFIKSLPDSPDNVFRMISLSLCLELFCTQAS